MIIRSWHSIVLASIIAFALSTHATPPDGSLSLDLGLSLDSLKHFDLSFGFPLLDKLPTEQQPQTFHDDWTTNKSIFNKLFGADTPNSLQFKPSTWPEVPSFQKNLISKIPDLLMDEHAALPNDQDLTKALEGHSRIHIDTQGSVFDVMIPPANRRGEVDAKIAKYFTSKYGQITYESSTVNQISATAYRYAAYYDSQQFEPYIQGQSQLNSKFAITSTNSQSREWKSLANRMAVNARPWLESKNSMALAGPSENVGETTLRLPSLLKLAGLLETHSPQAPQQQAAWRIAHDSLRLSQNAYDSQNQKEYETYFNIAKVMTDVAIGFVPVVGPARDLYQAVTGESLLDGHRLTQTERTLCAASVVTFGILSEGTNILKAIKTLATDGRDIIEIEKGAVRLAQTLKSAGFNEPHAFESLEHVVGLAGSEAKQEKALTDLTKNIFERQEHLGLKLHIEEVQDVGYSNWSAIRAGRQAPYADGTWALKGTIEASPPGLVRVASDPSKTVGDWITHSAFIENRTASEIQKQVLNLPRTPSVVSEVTLPVGTPVRISVVGPNGYGSGEGALQIEILREPDKSWFGTPRALK